MLALSKQVSVPKIAAMYMGAVIGAGFASGQEILQFIIVHGQDGIKEVVLVTFLFCYLGAITLYLSRKLGTNNYLVLLNFLVGKKLAKLIDIISLLMLAGGLSVMLSGSGAVFSEHFNIPAWYGILIIAGINCLVLLCGMHGVLWINVILVPLKITAILITSLLLIQLQNNPITANLAVQQSENIRHWTFSGLLYVSYNMILVIAVLSTIGKDINTKSAIAGGILGGLGLGVTAGVMVIAGLTVYPEITNYKVPMIYMAGIIGAGLRNTMGLLIWLAILTTTVANAHGFASRVAEPGSYRYKMIGIGITLLAIPLARLDFDKLVGIIYPIFGYAGLLLIIILLVVPPVKYLR
ncbi:hypothetical protein [Desulfallas thermosapovorans]|uniref:Putative membrane protein YkvI n=1 Tax=Desulfallas thermosapovorans DSM 6562 TaxID=1121431 RepID=A0A5S4ZU53_9FIRM|nr:hypothetical protein [Desulfallas thermosapovorans]TYO96429.1 putative membrane protein YkvI [Desulfallas thermosapovorans DSM 6562]